MKKIISILFVAGFFSCQKEEAITPNYSGLVVKESGSNYYAEILHKELFEVGDTLTITYNEMPKHKYSYPSSKRNEFVKVVIVRF